MATFAMEVGAVVEAEARQVSDGRVGVLGIKKVGGVRRTLLGETDVRCDSEQMITDAFEGTGGGREGKMKGTRADLSEVNK